MLNGVSPQGTSPSGLLRRVAVTSIEEDADANINTGGARARASGGAGMGAAVRARAGHAPSMNSTAVLPAVVASGVDRLLIHGDGDSE